jgi:hypothetical protein
VTFFVTRLWPGRHTYTYLMRATTAGEFGVLPAQVYPMYAEEMWGRSASQRVRVSPASLADRPALAGDFDHDCRITEFDTRQMAGAWGTRNELRDLDGDGDVDLRDVAAVASRQGATCLADKAMPGIGAGRVDFAVTPQADTITVGQAFNVDVTLENTAGLGGFGLTLTFDPARLRTVGVTLDPTLTDALPLGPRIDNVAGRVAFGALGLPPGVAGGGKFATITFVGRRPGQAEVRVESAEAVDGEGRRLGTGPPVSHQMTVEGATTLLPLLRR